MDLQGLQESLALKDLRVKSAPKDASHPSRRQPAPPSQPQSSSSGLVADILSRHSRSIQPESRQLCLILNSLVEVITNQGLQPTPAAIFAALMSSLESQQTTANLEVTAAMCHLLDMILSRVPNSILRSKFVPAVQVLGTVVLQSSSSSPLPDGGTTATGGSSKCLRSATSCLCQVLAASDPQDWMPAVPAFNMVLNLSLDKRPKVRRRAQAGIEEVLASLQQQGGGGGPSSTSAALTQASQSIFKMCEKILPSPEAAARAAAAAASSKKRQQAEDAIAAAVSDALHLLGLLKKIISLLSVTCAADVCDMVVKLYPLHQPLLTQHANETLSTLFSSSSSPYLSSSSTTTPSPSSLLPVSALSALLHSVLADEAATATLGDRKQSDSTLSYVKLVEDGCVKVCELDARQGQTLLPRAFHLLAPLLAHDHGSVRFAVGQCLKNLIDSCIDSVAIKSALAHAAGSNKKQSSSSRPAPLLSIITAVEGSLGPRYQVGWEGSIPVASELLLKLGGEGGLLVTGVLDRLGEICSGADDAAGDKETRKKGNEDDSDEDMEEGDGGDGYEEEDLEKAARDRAILAAQNAIGVALRSQGPELVLSVLPMNLMEGLDGQVGEDDAARTWMLPLLRMHVTGARLDFWGQQLLLVARKLGTRAAAAGKGGRDQEAQVCSALEGQIWGTLPSFCRWAQDADEALRLYVKEIALAFEKRDDLRTPICLALRRLCVQTRIALHHYDNMIGYADPCSKATEDDEVLNNNNNSNNAALGNEGEEVEEHLGLIDEDSLLNELPSTWTVQVAQSNLKCLQTLAKTWLPQLLNAFVGAAPAGRRPIAAALSSYACLCDPALTAQAFKVALSKYVKATEQAKTGELGPDAVLDGGDSNTERRCTYIEAGLLLSGGLDSRALSTLCNAAKAAAEEREPALQKKGYKIMAYILESRADITQPQFQQLIEWLLLNVTTSLSAAKRYRLRCIKEALLLLIQPDGLPVSLPSRADHDIKGEEKDQDRKTKARAVVAEMVGEIILCLKEANKKTRAAAYELLVDLARAMQIADPPPHSHIGCLDNHDDDEHMHEEEDPQQHQDAGGLHALFTMVLGGLVGTSPHMISASVMGLARLLYEFAPVLVSLVPDLLPAVLMLLRSRAREVIKSVLGFVKVVAVRLPVADLVTALPSILEGILLWAEDSKNKFRLKVRVIMERVARRVGFEEMEKCMPEKHKRLLTHIRKANNRRERKKAAGSRRDDGDDEMEFDERSRKTRQTVAKTAGKSDWRDSVMDEDDADTDEDGEGNGGYSDRKSRAVSRTTDNYKRRGFDGGNNTSALLQSGEPVDLLNSKTSRQLVRAAAGISTNAANGKGRAGITFDHDERGRMIVKDDDDGKKKKRKRRTDGFDSEDSDFEDLKGFSGMDLALKGAKSVAMAPSIAASLGGKSMGGRSMGGRSMGGRSTKSTPPSGGGNNRHSGDRYKANKNNKASGGDAKGSSKVEPYAYWPLDRNMLNRRAQKTRGAKKGLDKVVKAAKEGAARGLKAKRQRR